MTFTTDYKSSAYRHFGDAELVERSSRFLTAGYHYGVATECAFKYALQQAGVDRDPTAEAARVMWRHFGPSNRSGQLKQSVFALGSGHLASALVKLVSLVNQPGFMDGWEIDMRYAPDNEVTQGNANDWHANATDALLVLV